MKCCQTSAADVAVPDDVFEERETRTRYICVLGPNVPRRWAGVTKAEAGHVNVDVFSTYCEGPTKSDGYNTDRVSYARFKEPLCLPIERKHTPEAGSPNVVILKVIRRRCRPRDLVDSLPV